ncbi:MAG: ferrochelatase [Rhodobacteraceae bacterium]|nr:ferrochelatase [Paracoccaceae bacterium]
MPDTLDTKTAKIGILLANLGTPDGYDYWSIRRYLGEFLSDQRVIHAPKWKWQPILQLVILSTHPFSSGKAYKSIWNTETDESPLLTITKQQTVKISEAMQARYGDHVMVDFCMRYGNPSVRSKVQKMIAAGCQKILFVPLYPQYAGATSATANDAFFRALMQETRQPVVRTIEPYYNQPLYIDALAQSIKRGYSALDKKPDVLVCSYHGIPKRYVTKGDPYIDQCRETTQLLRERLGWADTDIVSTFQSRFGPAEWVQPYTIEEVARLAKSGKTNIAVCAPAFSADCIETLEEINEEIKLSFHAAGGKAFTYIPCLNDNDAHITALTAVITQNLSGWID